MIVKPYFFELAMKVERFEDLELWQHASSIAIDIYNLCEENPKLKNDWGAKDQIRRAAFSISNNIAEGFEYNNNKDFIKFLRYSKGSAGELRNQLYVLHRAGVIKKETYEEFYNRLIHQSRQLKGFMKYLNEFLEKKQLKDWKISKLKD